MATGLQISAASSPSPATSHAAAALRPLSLWHLTSLDAPTVAVTWALAFAWAAHLTLPLWLPCVLALGCWSVYIMDRLLDSAAGNSPLRERHLFHARYAPIFWTLALASMATALALIVAFMPPSARGRNLALGVTALAYFAGVHGKWPQRSPRTAPNHQADQHRSSIPKEMLVGIIFTLACVTPTWARAPQLWIIPAAACFALLAWLNCYAIEAWEHRHSSHCLRLALALAAFSSLGALSLLAMGTARPALLLLAASLSAALLALLDRQSRTLAPVTLRALADAVLLLPLLLFASR